MVEIAEGTAHPHPHQHHVHGEQPRPFNGMALISFLIWLQTAILVVIGDLLLAYYFAEFPGLGWSYLVLIIVTALSAVVCSVIAVVRRDQTRGNIWSVSGILVAVGIAAWIAWAPL